MPDILTLTAAGTVQDFHLFPFSLNKLTNLFNTCLANVVILKRVKANFWFTIQ